MSGWDEVRTEQPVGSRVADIALLRQGSVIGVVEVFSKHAVDGAKRDELNALGMPWIEIAAHSGMAEALWIRSLEPLAFGPWTDGDPYRCAAHSAALERARTKITMWVGRLIDVYRADGQRRRIRLLFYGEFHDGRLGRVRCREDDSRRWHDVAGMRSGEIQDRVLRPVGRKVIGPHSPVLVDSPMRWAALPDVRDMPRASESIAPPRYEWDARSLVWRRIPARAALKWPDAESWYELPF